MAWNRSKPARKGAVPLRALFIGWTLATAVMIGVGATYYQQTRDVMDLYLWLSGPALALVLLLLFAMFSAITKPKAQAAPAPRPAHVRRRETTYGRR